jgi:hypothetical protein
VNRRQEDDDDNQPSQVDIERDQLSFEAWDRERGHSLLAPANTTYGDRLSGVVSDSASMVARAMIVSTQ